MPERAYTGASVLVLVQPRPRARRRADRRLRRRQCRHDVRDDRDDVTRRGGVRRLPRPGPGVALVAVPAPGERLPACRPRPRRIDRRRVRQPERAQRAPAGRPTPAPSRATGCVRWASTTRPPAARTRCWPQGAGCAPTARGASCSLGPRSAGVPSSRPAPTAVHARSTRRPLSASASSAPSPTCSPTPDGCASRRCGSAPRTTPIRSSQPRPASSPTAARADMRGLTACSSSAGADLGIYLPHRTAGTEGRAGGDALHPSCPSAPRSSPARQTGRPCGVRAAFLAIARTHVPGASRPADRDRRVLPASGGARPRTCTSAHSRRSRARRRPTPRCSAPPPRAGTWSLRYRQSSLNHPPARVAPVGRRP